MLLVAPVRKDIRTELGPTTSRLLVSTSCTTARSSIPGSHTRDYSARVQTVDQERNPLLHRLLTRFHEKTGCPVLINTSFNVRSEPIVCTPEDAYRCFMMTDMDVLVIGRHILLKEQQGQQMSEADRQEHLNQFQLD